MTRPNPAPHAGPAPMPGALRAFQAILDEFPGATYTCDVTGELNYFNGRAERLWGRRPRLHDPTDRFCGSQRLFFADGRPMPHDGCWMARAIRENRPFIGEKIVIERPGGERVTALAHANPIRDAAGTVVGGVNVLLDVTQDRADPDLVQTQQLESLGRLAAGVAHDFNNHLTVILGLASLALEELSIESPVRPLLQQVEVAARRASGLASQMSSFAAKETVRGELLELDRVVGDIRQLIEAVATRRVRLEFDLEPARVWGEVSRIRQVVVALVVNAVEAIEGGSGRVWIRTAQVNAAAEPFRSRFSAVPVDQGVYGMLEIRDAGSGIPEDLIPRIFDPFFTTRAGGRGLGLAAVRGIVTAHRGAVDVVSVPGAGATFRVYLPQTAP